MAVARPARHITQRIAAVVGALFGVATLLAGGRVLMGADPGYAVFRPLLLYNTAMGIAYVAAGAAIWYQLNRGLYAAFAVAVLNLAVFVGVAFLYAAGDSIAVESVRAMAFRTFVWLAIALVLFWSRGRKA
jgi:hypothetical protein